MPDPFAHLLVSAFDRNGIQQREYIQQLNSIIKMKKYTTPVLSQYNFATEGLMNLVSLPAGGGSHTTPGGAQTFEKQFSIWGDDQAADESDDMDFNSTGIF